MRPLPASTASYDTPSRPDSFRLDGPTRPLDPRTHAFRADLVDMALAGRRFAPHYARPQPTGCALSSTMVRATPDANGAAVTQLLQGEPFQLLDQSGGWAWGYAGQDGYVGYVPADALGPARLASHRVSAPWALLFAEADIKSRMVARLPVGARLAGEEVGPFLRVQGGFVHRRHVEPVDRIAPDWVAVAERLVGLPYLWGGRGGGGIDCSGLVQLALSFAGRPAPRDSDQQRAALGRDLPPDAPLRRGDLVFFPGHVGIMVDGERLLHANAWWMATVVEPLADVIARLADGGGEPVLARKRMDG